MVGTLQALGRVSQGSRLLTSREALLSFWRLEGPRHFREWLAGAVSLYVFPGTQRGFVGALVAWVVPRPAVPVLGAGRDEETCWTAS